MGAHVQGVRATPATRGTRTGRTAVIVRTNRGASSVSAAPPTGRGSRGIMMTSKDSDVATMRKAAVTTTSTLMRRCRRLVIQSSPWPMASNICLIHPMSSERATELCFLSICTLM